MSQASGAVDGPATGRAWRAASLPLGMRREWGWLLALVLVDAVWCGAIGMRFTAFWLQPLVVAGLIALAGAYRARSRRLADACEVSALWIGFSVAGCILTYLFATWALPPRDAGFDRLDLRLGFDWVNWRHFVEAHPALQLVLALAYASFMAQLLLAILVFALSGQNARNRELFTGAFVALVITAAVSGLLPALSAYSYYRLPELAPYLPDLLALRAGDELHFALPQLQGIVTFPSYHAVIGVLLAWSFRRTGWLGIAVGLWNLLMLVSVVSEGGHYLVDVIAGVAVALVAIWLARRPLSAAAAARTP